MSNPSNIARSLPQPRHSPNHSTIPNAKLYFSNRYLFNVPSICLFLHATKFRQRPWKPTLTFRIVVESQRNYPTRAIREWFRKDYTNKKERKEGKKGRREEERKRKKKGGGGGGNVRRLSNDRQLLPPFRAKVQRSEIKARRKNCHEWANRPRASSAHVYFTVYWTHTRWKRIHVCICTKGEERVETYEWYYALLHAVDPIALSSPPENRTPVVTPSVLLILPFHGLDDVYRSLRRRFHTSDTFWMTSKILRIFVYSYTVIEEWHLQQRYEEIIYSWWFRKFRNAGVQMKGMNRCFLSTFVCRNKKFKKD